MHDEKVLRRKVRRVLLAGVLALTSLAAMADGRRAGLPDAAGRPVYTAECGSCHVAYPPALLTATSWDRVMATLDKHFGVDASVDAATARTVSAYLRTHAGSERRAGGGTLRITETAWFRHEHDEVPAQAWKSPQTRSAANCAACHTGADRGDYSERGIRLPGYAPQ